MLLFVYLLTEYLQEPKLSTHLDVFQIKMYFMKEQSKMLVTL